jgi:hypothetical protein
MTLDINRIANFRYYRTQMHNIMRLLQADGFEFETKSGIKICLETDVRIFRMEEQPVPRKVRVDY